MTPVDNVTPRLNSALTGRYRLEGSLGAGGMALVYRAHDLKHDRAVALKVLRPDLAHALGNERFLREIRLTARLDHPHILPLLDSGEAEGFLYYIMPYVEGESLRDRLGRERQLPLDDALQITREVADALSYAHSLGIVHRDIKPENILLAGEHARVVDFGIARAVSAAGGGELTETGLVVGTPAYMSPEQAGGERELDGRSDVYALGCVAYEMLAGHPPFIGGSAHEVLARHSLDAVPRLSAARPSVPPDVEGAIATALAKAPADRFRTASLFAEALSGANAESARAGAAVPRRPRRMAAIGVAAVLVVAGAALIGRTMSAPSPDSAAEYQRTAIAVLPFQNLSPDPEHGYFAAGLHDELLTQLSKVAALKVISRTSVMGYAAPNTPPVRQIATELAVGTIVVGSVQVVGGRLRVNVQLIDAAGDTHLWAERYDRTLDDAFAIQSEIAQHIVAAVGAALGPAEEQRLAAAPTANPEAYRLYLQGLEYWNRPGRARQNWEAAQQLLERAVERDSSFALARATLAQVHGATYAFRHDPTAARLARRRQEAEAALRLDPTLPQAHAAVAGVHFERRDYASALDAYATALEGLPNDARILALRGSVHRRIGNWSESIADYQRAVQLDPRWADLFHSLGNTYRVLHRYEEAIRSDAQALRLAPDHHEAAIWKAWTYLLWRGQRDTLQEVLSRLPSQANLGAEGTTATHKMKLLHWERHADSMLVLLADASEVYQGRRFFLPAALYVGWARRLFGDPEVRVRAAFDSARVLIDSVVRVMPDDWRVHVARGLVLAGLRLRAEALAEAQWLQQSDQYRSDTFDGPLLAEGRAQILSQLGEGDAAVDEIERLLAGPSWISVYALRLDPLWDPIREHPRFQALLAIYGG